MEQDYQIEALIKEILKMLENGVSFKNIKDTFVSDVPEYYIYNSYCAAKILLADKKKIRQLGEEVTTQIKIAR